VTAICSAALLACLIVLGIVERRARDRARAAIPIRIHVNGTRGKSTVVRLVAGALREAGVSTVAKTTGTEPRLILPDGRERVIRRRAPASVREQLWFMREAHRLGATAIVVECMAVDPELQAVSEHQMIGATIGVITNARPDHAEVMGSMVEDVAAALSATIPRRATLVVGTTEGADVLERAARERETRVVRADAVEAPAVADADTPWAADNVRVAVAVTRILGIPDETARRGMLNASPDPGAVRTGSLSVSGRQVEFIDAAAANDPHSLRLLLGSRARDAVFVFHHRRDRPARLRQFADMPPWSGPGDALVVTGDRPDWSTWRRLRRATPGSRLAFVPPRRLADALRRGLGASAGPELVVFCGNTKGFRRGVVLATIERG
jgi:gamma-polyglutamate synthase